MWLGILIAALLAPGISRSLKFTASAVAGLAAAYLITNAYLLYKSRLAQANLIEATKSPLALTINSRSLPNDKFAAVLNVKNAAPTAVEIYSYGAQNQNYGYFRDVQPGTMVIAPGETRTVSLGHFPAKEGFDLAVQVHLSEQRLAGLADRGVKASFEKIAKDANDILPTVNRPVERAELNSKSNFIATVIRFPVGTLDFNLTKQDPDGWGGKSLNTQTGNLSGLDYEVVGSGLIQPGGFLSFLCGIKNKATEARLPVTILSDQFDTPVKLHWNFPLRTCTLEVGSQSQAFTF